MWINNISEIIYRKCLKDDKKEYWSLITDDRYIYYYCKNVKDRPEMWNKIIDNIWIYHYCDFIKDRSKLVDRLTEDK